ncbi:MAG: hypothetical protein VXW65_13430 [Pseudomonadota bacterium]|nr:hypothetical protein [Pseudomonadota bacterium]
MNAREILDLAQQHGVQVSIEGERLHLEAQRPPPPNLIDLLRNHKADLLAYLASQAKHPTHHTGAYIALTANQSRALAAIDALHQRAQQRLAKINKPLSDAEVCVSEWYSRVQRRLVLSLDEMRDLERSLINLGMIQIDTHRNYVSLSNGQPLAHQQTKDSDQLAWDGYRSFSQWLYS